MDQVKFNLKGCSESPLDGKIGVNFEVVHDNGQTTLAWDINLTLLNDDNWLASIEHVNSQIDRGGLPVNSTDAANKLAERLERIAQAIRVKADSIGRFTNATEDLMRRQNATRVTVAPNKDEG